MNKLQKFMANLFGIKAYSGDEMPYRGMDLYNGVSYPPSAVGLTAQEKVSWIYACVKKTSNRVASVQWYLKRNDREMMQHRAWKVFQAGNQYMTNYDLINLTVQSLELLGEAHWLMQGDNRGRVNALMPLNSSGMELQMDKYGLPDHWIYTTASLQQRLEFSDVVYFRYPNPDNAWRGLSPLRAAAKAADTDIDAASWNRNFFNNAAVPSGIFTSEDFVNADQELRMKQWLRQFYGAKNAHKVMLLENGMKFEPVQISQKDMEFLELRRFTRNEICAVYGVPPDLLGISENSNRATAIIHEQTYAKDTLTPIIRQIQGALNKYYLANFEDGLTFTFDSVVPQDELVQATINTKYVAAKVLTPDEVRATIGYDPLTPEQKEELNPTPQSQNQDEKTLKKKDLERIKRLTELQQNIRRVTRSTQDNIKGFSAGRFTSQQKEIIRRLERLLLSEKMYRQKQDEIEDETPKMSYTQAAFFANVISEWILQGDEQRAWSDYFRKVMPSGLRKAAEVFDDEFGIGINFRQFDENVENMIFRRSQRFAVRINETTYNDLRVALVDLMVEKGLNERELKATINSIMGDARRSRPETIARTEVFSAVNESHLLTLRDNGIEKKEWNAAFDERTREAHAAANGQIVGVNEPFLVGGERLMYPGDPSGSAANVINCRCVVIPVIER